MIWECLLNEKVLSNFRICKATGIRAVRSGEYAVLSM